MATISSTVIHIDGFDTQTLPIDLPLSVAASTLEAYNVSSMNGREEIVDGVRHLYYTRRNGTKG